MSEKELDDAELLNDYGDFDFNAEPEDKEEEGDEDDDISSALPKLPALAAKKEEEIAIPKVTVVDEEKERLKEETAALKAENDRIKAETLAAREDARNARKAAIEGDIKQAKDTCDQLRAEATKLTAELERARIAQDSDRAAEIATKLSDIGQRFNQASGNINAWNQALTNLPAVQQPEPVKPVVAPQKTEDAATVAVREKATKWAAANSWYEDPEFSAKRQKAESLWAELVAKKYNPATDAFWSYMDKELAKVGTEQTQRRSAPPVRPIANSNAGVQNVSERKQPDKEILAKVNNLMKMRGIDENNTKPEKLKEMKIKAYKSYAKNMSKANATA